MNKRHDSGYIALFTVIIIMAVVLTTTATITFLSIGEAQSSYALYKGEGTLAFVEGCAEDALWKSRGDSNYNGGTIIHPEGTCVIESPIEKIGTQWTIRIYNQITPTSPYKRIIEVVFNRLSTGISIVSWKEKET